MKKVIPVLVVLGLVCTGYGQDTVSFGYDPSLQSGLSSFSRDNKSGASGFEIDKPGRQKWRKFDSDHSLTENTDTSLGFIGELDGKRDDSERFSPDTYFREELEATSLKKEEAAELAKSHEEDLHGLHKASRADPFAEFFAEEKALDESLRYGVEEQVKDPYDEQPEPWESKGEDFKAAFGPLNPQLWEAQSNRLYRGIEEDE